MKSGAVWKVEDEPVGTSSKEPRVAVDAKVEDPKEEVSCVAEGPSGWVWVVKLNIVGYIVYSWSWDAGCDRSGCGDATLALDLVLPSPSSSGVLLARFLPFALLDMGASASSTAQRLLPEGPAPEPLAPTPT